MSTSPTGFAYDCRRTTNESSFMANHERALYQLQNTYQNCNVYYKIDGVELGTHVRSASFDIENPLSEIELKQKAIALALPKIRRLNPNISSMQIEITGIN